MVTSVFDSIQNQHNSKLLNTYHHRFLTYYRMTQIFHLSNHAYQPTKSVVNSGPGPVSP